MGAKNCGEKRFKINKFSDTNNLPLYNIFFEKDIVMFIIKDPKNKLSEKLPCYVTKKELVKLAKSSETYNQAKYRNELSA